MLTRKQYELLRFISERLKESGVPPSFDEMKDALDLRSKSGIHRLITALEERGFIRRLPNRARAIEVIKLPELSAGAGGGGGRRGFTPSVIEGNLGKVRSGGSADDGSNRGRYADRGVADQEPHHQRAAGHARLRRALRTRSARRFDGRCRHPRWRHGADPAQRNRGHRRYRGGADRRRGG